MPPQSANTYGEPVRPRRRGRARNAEPQTAADLVSAVVARLGGEARALEQRVFDRYDAVVGELLRLRTQPESLRGATLYVRTSSSAIAHQLTVLRGEIVAKLAAELGPGVVTEIRTKVGPLSAR